jgi:hypothetical protein
MTHSKTEALLSARENALEQIIDILADYVPDDFDNPENLEVIEEILAIARLGRFYEV